MPTCPQAVSAAIAFETLEGRTLLSAGGLDTTFGNGAFVELTEGLLTATEIMTDGRLVATGSNGTIAFSVHRIHVDGTPDGSFGTAGRTISELRQPAAVFGVALQSDNKIVVAGSLGFNGFFLRYLTNGKHDKLFANGGLVTVSFPGATVSVVRDVSVLSDGKFLVAGEATLANGSHAVALARFKTDGTLDASFGTSGFTLTKFSFPRAGPDTFSVNRLTVAPNGALLIAGRWATSLSSADSGEGALAVARFTPSGIPDGRFGSSGLALRDFGTLSQSATGITLDELGRPVVSVSGATVLGALRLTTRGRGDTTFGTNGLVRAPVGTGNANDVLLDNVGRVVVAGVELGVGKGVLARFNTDGSIDTDFGDGGVSEHIPFSGSGSIQHLELAPDTSLLAAGIFNSGVIGTQPRIAVARFFPSDGPLGRAISKALTTLTSTSYKFRVEWRSSEGIKTSTLGSGNLLVNGPNNYSRTATFVGFDDSFGPNRVVATYKVGPPLGLGTWDAVSNGTYTIHVRENQVADLEDAFAPPGALGTFQVAIV